MTDLIPVKVAALSLSNLGFVILLRSPHEARAVPVFIGAPEAQAIAMQIERIEVPRPLTHDLFKSVLDCLECRLKRVVITRIQDNTFYAELVLERDGLETSVDARPSDAIALALRCGAPILLARQVLEQAGVILPQDKEAAQGADKANEAAKEPASKLEQLKRQLEQAVAAEHYEEAARLRDELRLLQRGHAHN